MVTTYTAIALTDNMAEWAGKQGFTGRSSYLGLGNVVDWGRYLRVLDPCVSRGSC